MLPFPGHLPVPALAETAPPAAGVQAGRRPPEGLGLDAGEDGATLHRPGPQSAIATNQLPNVTQITYTDNLTSSRRRRRATLGYRRGTYGRGHPAGRGGADPAPCGGTSRERGTGADAGRSRRSRRRLTGTAADLGLPRACPAGWPNCCSNSNGPVAAMSSTCRGPRPTSPAALEPHVRVSTRPAKTSSVPADESPPLEQRSAFATSGAHPVRPVVRAARRTAPRQPEQLRPTWCMAAPGQWRRWMTTRGREAGPMDEDPVTRARRFRRGV